MFIIIHPPLVIGDGSRIIFPTMGIESLIFMTGMGMESPIIMTTVGLKNYGPRIAMDTGSYGDHLRS